ncbi:MAG: hydroxyacylglutathione hydrolase [Candidatus Nitrotoga sp.]
MLNIFPVPALKDNYIWILHNAHHAVVVDPGDAAPVLDYLQTHQLKLAAVLCTHHHADHVAGVCQLVASHPASVYFPQRENISCGNHAVGEGDVVNIPELKIQFSVLNIPGHTLGHVAYIGAGGVFCGDTLFGCGCGRLFEGTATQLLHALKKLAALPDDTRVYCGHEYTESNIRFALACEPDNAQLVQRQQDVQILRTAGQPTLPSNIALEKSTNPFLRCAMPVIIQAVQQQSAIKQHDEISIFTALRAWKDTF